MSKILLSLMLAVGVMGSVYAADDAQQIPLKDGSTLLVFKDGKMSMRDKNGRTMSMKDGVAMETKDGKKLMMKGNEVWRRLPAEELYKPQ